jgi:hypothetical protein
MDELYNVEWKKSDTTYSSSMILFTYLSQSDVINLWSGNQDSDYFGRVDSDW